MHAPLLRQSLQVVEGSQESVRIHSIITESYQAAACLAACLEA